MLDQPLYTELVDEAAGGDPLGTAPVNEMLYRSTFPGINNVVRFIRIYSAICWMVRQIDSAARKQKNPDIEELSNIGLEKIQLLITWYNVMQGVGGLAGATRVFPVNNRRVTLRFRSIVGRIDAKATELNAEHISGDGAYFLQAVQYGPSIINGMRFLATTSIPNAFQLTEAGEALADAFEAAVAEHPWRNWLADLKKATVTRAEVYEEMEGLLNLNSPSKYEIAAFGDQFFPEKRDTAIGPNWQHRHAGVTLALRALEAEQILADEVGTKGVTVDELRYAMARGCASNGTLLNLNGIEQSQGWWANLQLRQYLRTALDTLFRCAESWIQDAVVYDRPRDTIDCARGLGTALTAALPDDHRATVGSLFEEIQGHRGKYSSLYAASPYLSKEMRLEYLRLALVESCNFEPHTDMEATALRNAYIALIYCGAEAENLRSHSHIEQQYDNERVSLAKLRFLVNSHANSTPAEFMAHIVQFYVLLLHFSVVQERSGDGRNRFRLLKGDWGLERAGQLVALSGARILEDRLEHAVLLLAQCRIVREISGGRFVLTKEGRRRLKHIELN